MDKITKRIKKHTKRIKHSPLAKWWRRYEYKHTSLAILAIVAFVLALDTALVQGLLDIIKHLGIPGIILSGMLFVSFFTAVPAAVLLIELTDFFDPLTVAFFAAIGSAAGDLILLKFFQDKVGYELKPLVKKWKLSKLIRSLKRKKNRERTVLLGMFAIASPLPDEMGIALLGISHLPTISLIVITFLLNAAGILTLVLVL